MAWGMMFQGVGGEDKGRGEEGLLDYWITGLLIIRIFKC